MCSKTKSKSTLHRVAKVAKAASSGPWGSTLQSRRPLQRNTFHWSYRIHLIECPQVISSCYGDEQAERKYLWYKKKKTEEKGATKQRLLKSLTEISQKCKYNSSSIFGMNIKCIFQSWSQYLDEKGIKRRHSYWADPPLSAYCLVRQFFRAFATILIAVRKPSVLTFLCLPPKQICDLRRRDITSIVKNIAIT